MSPKEKRAAAVDYAKGINASRLIEGETIEIADHWLAGYKSAESELDEQLTQLKGQLKDAEEATALHRENYLTVARQRDKATERVTSLEAEIRDVERRYEETIDGLYLRIRELESALADAQSRVCSDFCEHPKVTRQAFKPQEPGISGQRLSDRTVEPVTVPDERGCNNGNHPRSDSGECLQDENYSGHEILNGRSEPLPTAQDDSIRGGYRPLKPEPCKHPVVVSPAEGVNSPPYCWKCGATLEKVATQATHISDEHWCTEICYTNPQSCPERATTSNDSSGGSK